jgi:hypothetical protein
MGFYCVLYCVSILKCYFYLCFFKELCNFFDFVKVVLLCLCWLGCIVPRRMSYSLLHIVFNIVIHPACVVFSILYNNNCFNNM